MARSATTPASPVVCGAAARAILKEMREGTPNSPERDAFFARADAVYRRFAGGSPFGRPLPGAPGVEGPST